MSESDSFAVASRSVGDAVATGGRDFMVPFREARNFGKSGQCHTIWTVPARLFRRRSEQVKHRVQCVFEIIYTIRNILHISDLGFYHIG